MAISYDSFFDELTKIGGLRSWTPFWSAVNKANTSLVSKLTGTRLAKPYFQLIDRPLGNLQQADRYISSRLGLLKQAPKPTSSTTSSMSLEEALRQINARRG